MAVVGERCFRGGHLRRSLAGNAEQRAALADALRGREADLLERGVVLRPLAGYGLSDCLRITVGTSAENLRLLAALDAAR